MNEAKLQSQIIKWLKSKGAYVIKNRAAPGVPVGCPDVLFLYEGAWGVVEVKRSEKAPFRAGQEMTLRHLRGWSPYVYVAWPDNWPIIRDELATIFF